MERISIFNYEAFYLDHLEGNLNEEDTALLLAFLEENPDLVEDDLTLTSYEPENVKLESTVKAGLKQPLMTDEITEENVEFFMISRVENLLSNDKIQELDHFIKEHPEYLSDYRRYNRVILHSDTSIQFNEKASLKKKRVVMWPYMAAASILAAILIITSINNNGSLPNGSTTITAKKKSAPKVDQPTNEKDLIIQESLPIHHTVTTYQKKEKGEFSDDLVPVEKIEFPIIEEQERQPINQVLVATEDQKRIPVSKQAWEDAKVATSTDNDYAALHFSEMQNPIEPVTKFISNKTEKPVEFRTSKKTEKKAGGFYLRVGKFELSRKKH